MEAFCLKGEGEAWFWKSAAAAARSECVPQTQPRTPHPGPTVRSIFSPSSISKARNDDAALSPFSLVTERESRRELSVIIVRRRSVSVVRSSRPDNNGGGDGDWRLVGGFRILEVE